MKTTTLYLSILLLTADCGSILAQTADRAMSPAPATHISGVWSPDQGDGTYKNPVLNADYSDPDAIRVGDRFYLVASSFDAVPGLPILESFDLVNWGIVGHALDRQPPFDRYARTQHGNGVWAPSLRYHGGLFYIFYPDPDLGIYMTKSTSVTGLWSAPLLIKAAKGWIDPCPLWDDDGHAYLVSALAASRSGAKSAIIISRMKPDGSALVDGGTLVYDGHGLDPTIEGPKLYKRNGYYYIFAPAGGVPTGWQLALRSRNIYGPYERRVVLQQGSTPINGPHQGAWVNTGTGEDWFLHFQDRGWLGRVVLLEPMKWVDDWPQIGDLSRAPIGQPVLLYRKPRTLHPSSPQTPADSDEFNDSALGPQWQWQANPEPTWAFPSQALGYLRLICVPQPDGVHEVWDTPAVLLQKAPGTTFTATTKLMASFAHLGDRAGIVVMGKNYGYLELIKTSQGLAIRLVFGSVKDGSPTESPVAEAPVSASTVYLQSKVADGHVSFAYSIDGEAFRPIGDSFVAAPGIWIGAKIGIFSGGETRQEEFGYADFDWFRLGKL